MSNTQIKLAALAFIGSDAVSAEEPYFGISRDYMFVRVEDSFGWTNIVEVDCVTLRCELVHVH
jgi:hypothetical protein